MGEDGISNSEIFGTKKRGRKPGNATGNCASTTGTGAGPGTGPGTGTEEKESDRLSFLTEIEVPEKPKKKRKEEKGNNEVNLKPALDVGISGFFMILASKNPIWQVTQKEVDNVTIPLARMLERALQVSPEKSDPVILALGVFGIIIPRVGFSVFENIMKKMEKKKEVNFGSEGKSHEHFKRSNPDDAASLFGNVKDNLQAIQ